MTHCVHANWSAGRLCIWSETAGTDSAPNQGERSQLHPFAGNPEDLRSLHTSLGAASVDSIRLVLPSRSAMPVPSPAVAGVMAGGEDDQGELALTQWEVPVLAAAGPDVDRVIRGIEARVLENGIDMKLGPGTRYFAQAARFAGALMAEQRFVPAIVQQIGQPLRAVWQPWLSDEATEERFVHLLSMMPPIARAAVDELGHDGKLVLQEFMLSVVDGRCRVSLGRHGLSEAIDGRDPLRDRHVAWLSGLLDGTEEVQTTPASVPELVKRARQWLGTLEDRGVSGEWKLLLALDEPESADKIADLAPPGGDVSWTLTFALRSKENEGVILDAIDIWAMGGQSASIGGQHIESPGELLLAELARTARIWPLLEKAIHTQEPTSLELTTEQAYEFLREIKPLLAEQGVEVRTPEWWDTPSARIGARLQLDPLEGEEDGEFGVSSAASAGEAKLGLSALVNYQWRIAVGDTALTLKEFEQLAQSKSPLLRINNQWVEVRPEDIQAAMAFIAENPGGKIKLGEAMRLAFGAAENRGLSVLGVDSTGWLASILDRAEGDGRMPMINEPEGFHATLRPYQRSGLSWLAFLDRIGLGPCLADDMGLGKTIQLLALLAHEQNEHDGPLEELGPTLVVVPMSIVDNWQREATKFAPSLKVMIHHGADRLSGEAFATKAAGCSLVITTYALANRDKELLERVQWRRVVLDEAQNIKNPQAKQSQAVRSLQAERRIALTGTPLENRLSELWSIMDFCNPGLLGGPGEFRRAFGVPIERYHDRERSEKLRALVRPFVLRRVKTDPTVISDLPEKLETKEFCRLTSEQAELYETCVKRMMGEIERAEGIKRRGIVLTTLIRLKQICNHPAQMLKDEELTNASSGGQVQASRSGKCIRLLELLDEVLSEDQQALVFTQFRQMGTLLVAMLKQQFGREVLFLHGGTPQRARAEMIDRFQKGDGTNPIFVLSLKAGGVGLNLTAASHVFHFDRWWNPAVENQATDRAFRIGQTKTVNVHKFIVGGTLEDRIDQMIESKVALAEDIIGKGDEWLTELDVAELQDVLKLRPEAALAD